MPDPTLVNATAIPGALAEETLSLDAPARAGDGGDVEGEGDSFGESPEGKRAYDRISALEKKINDLENGRAPVSLSDIVNGDVDGAFQIGKSPLDISARPILANSTELIQQAKIISIRAKSRLSDAENRLKQFQAGGTSSKSDLLPAYESREIKALFSLSTEQVRNDLSAESTQKILEQLRAQNTPASQALARAVENRNSLANDAIETAMNAYLEASLTTERSQAQKDLDVLQRRMSNLDRYLDGARVKKLEELGLNPVYTPGQRALGVFNRFVVKPAKFAGAAAKTSMDIMGFIKDFRSAFKSEKLEIKTPTPPTFEKPTKPEVKDTSSDKPVESTYAKLTEDFQKKLESFKKEDGKQDEKNVARMEAMRKMMSLV